MGTREKDSLCTKFIFWFLMMDSIEAFFLFMPSMIQGSLLCVCCVRCGNQYLERARLSHSLLCTHPHLTQPNIFILPFYKKSQFAFVYFIFAPIFCIQKLIIVFALQPFSLFNSFSLLMALLAADAFQPCFLRSKIRPKGKLKAEQIV